MNRLIIFLILIYSNVFANDLQKVSIQLQWLDQFQFAGYYVAKEKGFYEDVGLDVEIKKFDYGIDVLKEVTKGDATYGIGRTSLIYQKSNGADVKLISSIFQSSPVVIIATKKSGITSIHEFNQKRIMTTPDLENTASLYAMKNRFAISSKDMNMLKHSFNIQDLISNKTDLMVGYISNEPYLLKQKGIDITLFNPADYGFNFYSDMLFTSSENFNDNRDERFREASLKGWEYAFSHIDETIELILKKYNEQNKSKEALLYEANTLKKLAYVDGVELGDIDKNKIQRIYDIYSLMGLTSRTIDMNKFIYSKRKQTQEELSKLTKDEELWILSNPIMKLATMRHWKQDKDGRSRHKDIVSLLNKYSKLNISLVSYDTWSGGYADAVSGEVIHGILNLSWNKERAKNHFFYTKAYAFEPNYLIVKEDNTNIKSIEDIDNSTIFAITDSITNSIVKDNSENTVIILENDYNRMYERLSIGREAIALVSYEKKEELLKKYHLKVAQIIFDKYSDLSIGINQKYPLLKSIINKAYMKIPKRELDACLNKTYIVVDSKKTAFTTKEQNWIDKNPKLKVLIDRDWYPFLFQDEDDDIHGIAIDYMQHITSQSGIEFEYIVDKSSKSLEEKLQIHNYDMLACVKKTPKRDKSLNFSDSYVTFPVVAITRDDISFISSLDEVQDKRFALVKDLSSTEMIKSKYRYLKYKEYSSELEAMRAVSNSDADVFVSNMATVSYILKRHPLSNLKIAGQLDLDGSWGVGFKKEIDSVSIEAFNIMFSKIDKQDRDDILNKWMSINLDTTIDYTILYQIAVAFIIFLLVTLYWYKKLSASKREAQNAKEFSTGIMDSQKDIIITIGADGKLENVNRSFLKFYEVKDIKGFKERYGECICDTFEENISSKYLQSTIDGISYFKYMLKNPTQPYEAVIKKDGELLIFSATVNIFRYQGEEIYTMVFKDVTELNNITKERELILQSTMDNIEYASHIQSSIIPDTELFSKYFDDSFVVWEPKHIVGGDIYLLTELSRGQRECLLMVIDCTGHGVSGAFVTMLVKAIERQVIAKLNSNRYKDISPAWILSYFNNSMKSLLKQETKDNASNAGFDGQVIYYNKDTNIFKSASARNEIFYVRNNTMTTIKPDKHSIGYADSRRDFEFKDTVIYIDREVVFYVPTDGYWDQIGGPKKLSYGKKRFKNLILENLNKGLDKQKKVFLDSLATYQDTNERNDDLTLVAVKLTPQEIIQEMITLLKFEGVITQDVISTSIDILEDKILNISMQSIVSVVFVELCQNIMRHSLERYDEEIISSIRIDKYGEDEYIATSKYSISGSTKDRLELILKELESKNLNAIKESYKKLRAETSNEMVDEILRYYEIAKVAQSIEFEFVQKNSDRYVFKFKAMITSLYKRSSSAWVQDSSLLKEVVGKSEIILSYSEELSQEVLNTIIDDIKLEFHKIDGGRAFISKLSYIIIEQVQNILSYSADTEISDTQQYTSDGIVMIGYNRKISNYFVATSNTIKEKDILKLSKKIDYINSLSLREKKDYYKKLLFSGENQHNRGAGIGLISIARKSSRPLEYRLITTPTKGLTFQLVTYI